MIKKRLVSIQTNKENGKGVDRGGNVSVLDINSGNTLTKHNQEEEEESSDKITTRTENDQEKATDKDEINNLHEKIRQMEISRSELQSKADDQTKQNTELNVKIKTMENDAVKNNAQLKKLENEVNSLKVENEKVNYTNKELEAKIEQVAKDKNADDTQIQIQRSVHSNSS